jgi:hypothetical protein
MVRPSSNEYHGGPLLTHVQVQGVYYNDPTTLGLESQFDGFFRDILQSPWLTQMLANYSVPGYTIGAGSFLGDDNTGVTVPEGSVLDIGAIYNQLVSEVANRRLAAPNDNTLYSVFVPAGVEVFRGSVVAVHVSVFDPTTRKAIFPPFLVIPYQGAAPDGRTGPDGPNPGLVDPVTGGPAALSEFQGLTIALSHELSETIADPIAGTGWGEIGDLAQGQWVTYHGYAMQEEWGRSPTDPPNLALGPAVAPADTDFAVTQINTPTTADRCHLNGLGMVDGKPKYVTALGETNEMAGWRQNKAKGGILIDVDSGEVLCRGLSMPHSPRWYGGRLWVCESGSGTLGTVDPSTGRYEAVAAVPGFTRGLDIVGDLAFVGLSQVRESAVFSGIPITERLAPEERTCGVSVVDLRRGEVVALLKFTSGVQEVFAVALLPRRFPDLINDDEKLLESSFVVPTECLGEVAATVRASGPA